MNLAYRHSQILQCNESSNYLLKKKGWVSISWVFTHKIKSLELPINFTGCIPIKLNAHKIMSINAE